MFRRIASNLDLAVAGTALAVVVASVSWGVATRYIFSQPATWTTELSSIAFAWVVFFGASAAMRRGLHIGIPILVDTLPAPVRKAATTLAIIIVTGFLAYATYLAGLLALQSFNRPSPVLRISFAYVYGGVALALSITTLHAALQFLRVFKSRDGTICHFPEEARGVE